ncbi:MAG TPA: T9SS type A sorting domain-containing protein [Bacteroidota bacterium]|nr:T9SS type A sorting domain-containing protein [Bacteroidota bacterium]
MKSFTVAVLCLFVTGIAFAQFTIVSTVPANNATNVSASTTTVSITFSAAVDTTMWQLNQGKSQTQCSLTSFDSLTAVSFSGDHKTVNLTVRLSAGKPYFFAVFSAKSQGGVQMAAAQPFYFTTAASFPATTVSGTVLSGGSGVGTAGAFVALSSTSLQQGDPQFVAGAIADIAGNFTIPYVPNGTLYPLAAKDVNLDGGIDPNSGDAVGTGDAVVVSGSNLTGITITFLASQTYRFKDALDTLNAHKSGFPAGTSLRAIQGSSTDSTGKSAQWEFDYAGATWQTSFIFRLESFGAGVRGMDTSQFTWVKQGDPIVTMPVPAVVDSFLARAERSGGHAYRPVPMTWNGFDVRVNIGDLRLQGYWDMEPDTSKDYLGVTYWYGTETQNNSITLGQRRFLGDYVTGNILGTTGVSASGNAGVPGAYALEQNYPNPFNPSTSVEFALPAASQVRLSVYNLLGQEVATLVNGQMAAGTHTVRFDASKLSSGVYLYRLTAGSFAKSMKLLIMK